ncbi:MAG: hypothetical protein KJO26_09685, partial [Deltaproteobacteria bacterium]|nr:hypothetical protein [Deltaproteobacteria bacterium]
MISPMFVYGANKDDVLVEKYRIAHESRDFEALKAIVHWEGASERTHEIIEQRLALHLTLKIMSIEVRPLSGDEDHFASIYQNSTG